MQKFIGDETGTTAIEYGLIMALVFLAVVGAIQTFSDSVINILGANSDAIEGVVGADE
ncbi:MAG: Flp family type IVb pilin [Pseudomonadota bacterium]